MIASPLPDALRLLAPILNERLGGIFVAIQALIAHHFLRNPFLSPIIRPLWMRLNRARHCLARLTTRIEAGKPLPASRAGHPHKPRNEHPAPNALPQIPRAQAWLLKALGWHVAVYRTRLEDLLAEPGMRDLVAATPSLGRTLRPLCNMLGLPPPCPPPGHRRRHAKPPPTPKPAPPPAASHPATPPPATPYIPPPPRPPICDRHVFNLPRRVEGVLVFKRA